MHRLEDMRIIEDYWTAKYYLSEVDEYGQATRVVAERLFPNAIPQSARPLFASLYQCACGEEFNSWQEAKDHIDWDGNQRQS